MKVWVKSLLLLLAIGVPTILVGAFSPGPHAGLVLKVGVLTMLVGGIVVIGTAMRGERAERENDEREDLILSRAMRFTFAVSALAIQVVWAVETARGNSPVTAVDIVYYVFWFSFIAAYGYNRLRA